MVASTRPIASRVGAEIMERGGNAVDAAVAVGLALAVVWPSAGNLGGGGFLLVRRADGKAEVIDYRERAPMAATRDMYLDKQGKLVPGSSTVGWRAAAVPGTVAGLALAHERHGALPWKELLEPARRLAAEGFVVDAHLASSLRSSEKLLSQFPATARVLLPGGKPPEVGDRLVQKDLAATLARLADKGPREFYQGETARLLVADMKAHGGLITAGDLAEYRATVREPLRGSYRGHDILTVPPPSSGGIVLLEELNILERFPVGQLPWGSADSIHLQVEAMRRAFADRGALLGDADFVKVPVRGLISKDYAKKRAATIDPRRATASKALGPDSPLPYESAQTTHFSVVDTAGNVVSNTYTLNGSYGCGAIAEGTGMLWNNEMDDFAAAPGQPNMFGLVQGEANAIAPRKRPLSSMTPTIVVKDGKALFAVGSPGGPTIINTVLEVIVNVIDYGMNLRQAINAPRVHHQFLPDVLFTEVSGTAPETRAALEARGHTVAPRPPFGTHIGDAQGIYIDPRSGVRYGASDPRMGGAPAGY